MKHVYYKALIKQFGLWYSPQMTARIIREAKTYNWACIKDSNVKFHWKDIAEDIGISRNTISKIITGKQFPNKDTMDKLIKYLDLVA